MKITMLLTGVLFLSFAHANDIDQETREVFREIAVEQRLQQVLQMEMDHQIESRAVVQQLIDSKAYDVEDLLLILNNIRSHNIDDAISALEKKLEKKAKHLEETLFIKGESDKSKATKIEREIYSQYKKYHLKYNSTK